MSLTLLTASIVILSEGNNPLLLNHDFLEKNRIVPEGWRVKDLLVTPPFAHVLYDNNVQVMVDMNKLQFHAHSADVIEWAAILPSMAVTYLGVLPHVSYSAAGINFLFRWDGVASRSVRALLHEGPWLSWENALDGVVIEFHFRRPGARVNVRIVGDQWSQGLREGPAALSLSVNYHADFTAAQAAERAEFIRGMSALKDDFMTFAAHLPFSSR